MSENQEKIPFAIEMSRVIELLASQIYPTPFALLRENVQNSYDAILQRKHSGQKFTPLITIQIEPNRICVIDNGKGMSREDLRKHFWRAGSSSKNTAEAREAGVVGTFGIGAMANFGIAEELTVETENSNSERTICSATRSTLSVTEDCISFKELSPIGEPGTKITALIQSDKTINVTEAEMYISLFVTFLTIEIRLNGKLVSQNPIEDSVPKFTNTWEINKINVDLGEGIKSDVELIGAQNGDIRVALRNLAFGSQKVEGSMVLRQGIGNIKTFRSGFGLATTGISSFYQFGGIANFLFLQPTAGREALTTESISLLQKVVTCVDEFVSLEIASRPESNLNNHFINWAHSRQRYDLCSNLKIKLEPDDSISLYEVKVQSQHIPMLVYPGFDPAVITHASEEKPILILTRTNPRRDCEINYLRRFCRIEEITDDQRVLKVKNNSELSSAEKALAFRLTTVLSGDYFLEADIKFGSISHGLPLLLTSKDPVEIFLDPGGSTVQLILGLYDKEYSAFGHMVKDFVRNMIFPKIADFVPSSTRQGAEAFLKTINRSKEIFEYEESDLERLEALWQDYKDGKITILQVFEESDRIAVQGHQVLELDAMANVNDVVPDIIQNELTIERPAGALMGPQPSIERLDVSTERKLLFINSTEPALKGYRCFLALTDKVKEERGDFFLQPHRTSVVWGGQKALFIFEHHSGNYGLYYDLQTQNLISNESGGGTFETCTIFMKNRIFIPIPPAIQESFLPKPNEKKRFEIKCDILYIDKKLSNV